MWFFRRKKSPRRDQVRKNIAADRFERVRHLLNAEVIGSALLWLLFVWLCVPIISVGLASSIDAQGRLHSKLVFHNVPSIATLVLLVSLAAGLYVYHYQQRIIKNRTRALALIGLFVILLAATKLCILLTPYKWWSTGTAVTAAIILAIAYDQRFALGMGIFYCVFATLVGGPQLDPKLFFTAAAGTVTCCFTLKEIRTRIKLLKVSTLAAVIVFGMALALDFLAGTTNVANTFRNAGFHAGVTLAVGLLIQSLLPLIEKTFRIATSMTLLDYSDANQPLLKRLAMEAPGTFSHSLLVGSIAEAAAESIGRNGLLCRVGAYYHDIGKINKPSYFIENQIGPDSRHKELSPAMSQLIIIGHVKDGIEIAREYGLPAVLRQFIETHHGTTLVEYFYNEAKKKHDAQKSTAAVNSKKASQASAPPSESEFRYPGPKPRTKEAAIVMLADSAEGAVRSLGEVSPTRIEAVVHNIAMKRLQDGQFDECDLTLRELSQIEASISKSLAAHYHSRIAYPKAPDEAVHADAGKQPQAEASKQKQIQSKQFDKNKQ